MQTPQSLLTTDQSYSQQQQLQTQIHTQVKQLNSQNNFVQKNLIAQDSSSLPSITNNQISQQPTVNLKKSKEHTTRISPKKKLESDLEKYFDTYEVLKTKPENQKTINTQSNFLSTTPIKDSKNIQAETKGKTEGDEQQSEELLRYTQLTGKLKHALNTIQISKYSTQRMTLNQDSINQMYKRFEHYEKKRKEQIQKMAQELHAQELREVKNKPTINKNLSTSMKIEPIYQRYEKLIEAKNKKLEEERKKKQKLKEEQFLQYQRIFNQKNKKPEKMRTQEEFYDELVRWKTKKEQKVKQKKELEKSKQIQGFTFKPVINQKSKKLLMKTSRQPIFERQPKAPKIFQQQFSFKPQLNKRPHKKQ